jgi:S-adenosylmethionine-diacylglycerol 3-amino-3-carboxypropyl transferase
MVVRKAREKLHARAFQALHRRNLIYNACFEDPALDREALALGPDDRVVVITSAGCNALDYLLAGAGEVNAVDVNPIQNAVLELKAAGIAALDHDSFFALFGEGRSPHAEQMYRDVLRPRLSPWAQGYWDRYLHFFRGKGWRGSFYYRGTSGLLARLALFNINVIHRLRKPIEALLAAGSLDEQRAVYDRYLRPRLWSPWLRWLLSWRLTLSLMGVPGPQRDQLTRQYRGGVIQFVRDSIEAVTTKLPFADNYFWRVYLQGRYERDRCPEYLKKENFDRLRQLLPRLHVHTSTMTDFLRGARPGLTKFVLLDHMDWMSEARPQALAEEWGAILAAARPGARAIFRSAGLRVTYLDPLPVTHQGRERRLGELLRYHPELAARLHERDRVHVYGSFHIADLP